MLWLLPVLPLLGFLVNGILSLSTARTSHGPSRGLSGFVAVLFPALSFGLSLWLFQRLSHDAASIHETNVNLGLHLSEVVRYVQPLWSWFSVGDANVGFGFAYDALTGIMLLFITGIGTLIHLYSLGYMAHDRGHARFLAYLSLFLANMIVLVLGDGPLVTFLGWEGVGLCSYLLIGFWHEDLANGAAARKAFLVNRVGDLGFLLGLFFLWQILGPTVPFTYQGISEWFRDPAHLAMVGQGSVAALLTASTLLLFLGCTGKSAQIPLLTWLPDAMAGPTPVSALIHAATMVTSGVFLLGRMSDVFVAAPFTMHVIAVIGAATALWAAVTGFVQTDIKKVLAYSTVSQLGYMFLAVGVGAFDAGLFHVFTHAFFKAVLFLGAGSVIHALGGEQDMRRMGGLARKLPLTFAAMFAGWYAITGLPGGAGFWSKDLILEKTWMHGGWALYVVAIFTAVLTAVYMTRLMILVFWSPSRVDPEVEHHVHESPWSMALPLVILGLGSLGAGFAWASLVPGVDWFARTLAPVVGPAQDLLAGPEAHHPPVALLLALGLMAAFGGIVLSFVLFRSGSYRETESGELPFLSRFWTLLFDHLHAVVAVWPVLVVSWILDKVLNPLLFGLVRLVGYLVEVFGWLFRALQFSRLRLNMGLSASGALLVLLGYILVKELLK
ncbi:MAG: NADH-quinone oxidoreductase subunit L [Fibrobacteria bacterium]|nr:NADH-quinone oxidoreductase subunit L [Fibrobacteria bacterium]